MRGGRGKKGHFSKSTFWITSREKKKHFFQKPYRPLRVKDSQKRFYRDAKIKKLEEFWRENVVGIGLYNECVLWW